MLKGAFIGRDKYFSSTIIHFPVQCFRSVVSLSQTHPRKELVVSSLPKLTNDLGRDPSSWGSCYTFTKRTFRRRGIDMNMGGRSETTSECKSVTNSTRNSISQDDKGSELKGRKQAGRPASGDKKNENAEPSKLTYTSEEDIYYEPGGKRKKT